MNHIITEETTRALLKVIAHWAWKGRAKIGNVGKSKRVPKALSLAEANTIASFVQLMTDKYDPKLIRLYQEAARKQYNRDGEIEIDEDVAVVSIGDDEGAYVEAWVWVDWADHPAIEARVKELAK